MNARALAKTQNSIHLKSPKTFLVDNCVSIRQGLELSHSTLVAYQSINPILIRVYPRKWGWPDLPQQQSL